MKGGMQIGFTGNLGSHHLSPRGLLSSFICSLVCVEGVVIKCSLIQPKVVRSVHWCEKTKKHLAREYRDATALNLGVEAGGRLLTQTGSAYPTKDAEGNPLETEFGLCTYKNHQSVTIQEMPERAPLGQLPRSIDLILDYDLVDKCKPGDRVQCMGVYRAMGAAASDNATSGLFKTKVLCNQVQVIGQDFEMTISDEDVGAIKKIAARTDVLDVLGRSLAPSICGHDFIKKALVLQLIGGCEKNLTNGTHLRGDINILLVGDPSTAKSQLLRAVMGIAPLSVSTTGRGSSGVGLTAAVTNDAETGERRLEAGAMVLADRGVVCIDEFDKMSDADRVAIHEVMEQQTVTVAKAGIHACLNARCSVLAAANPVYGQYKTEKRPQDNIGLPDSLLSRFDLLFVVLDQKDAETDRKIARHVLAGHQYRKPGTDMEPESLSSQMIWEEKEAEEKHPVWNKVQPVMYGRNDKAQDVLHSKFLKKFVHYVKEQPDPELSDDAREYMAAQYASLRSKAQESNRTLPVTARQLETLIRVSTAFAKCRLSPVVEESDAVKAGELLQFALYHEVTNESTPMSENQPAAANSQNKRQRTSGEKTASPAKEPRVVNQATIEQREEEFKKTMMAVFAQSGMEEMEDEDLVAQINSTSAKPNFSIAEARSLLTAMDMSAENTFAYIDRVVTRI